MKLNCILTCLFLIALGGAKADLDLSGDAPYVVEIVDAGKRVVSITAAIEIAGWAPAKIYLQREGGFKVPVSTTIRKGYMVVSFSLPIGDLDRFTLNAKFIQASTGAAYATSLIGDGPLTRTIELKLKDYR